ncbi:hypothetical protein [Flavobacterium sedimenticola]|uniref:Uncharacterized protein n=1 Tax=Flavobacterium sedimenticola TaxID=3043286 RepID=A0ABT6XLR6_9FLAO|nr:hypothetical protein [Flavobacterium sedimenticola]MDI9256033.1 hypothetical protein [Flavobacterium sedimenticola]
MKTKLFYLTACFISLTFVSCETEESAQTNDATASKIQNSNVSVIADMVPAYSTDLTIRDQYDAGDVNVYFDEQTAYFEYKTAANWRVKKIQLYVGDFELVPTNTNGTAIPDRFPIKSNYANGTESVVYAVSKSALPDCFTVSARAEVYRNGLNLTVQNETAWGYGDKFSSRDWSMYFNICQPE